MRRAIGITLVLGLLASCAKSPPDIMTWSEYARGRYNWPYILRIAEEPGELLYFGARHTFDPGDPQIAEIESLWWHFRPTLALNEGGHPPIARSVEEAVTRFGEAGLLRYLAARDDVPVTTLDPSTAQEVAWLRRSFSADDVKRFFVLRAVAQFLQREGAEGLESEVNRVLQVYSHIPGLLRPPTSWQETLELYEPALPGGIKLQEVPLSWFDPTQRSTVLNDISRASSDYRDCFIVQTLARHVSEGQRVFAVVGGSHVVMQEAALRWTLSQGLPGPCAPTSNPSLQRTRP